MQVVGSVCFISTMTTPSTVHIFLIMYNMSVMVKCYSLHPVYMHQ